MGFKKWWSKQNDIALRMATPETIAQAAWNKATAEQENTDKGKLLKGCKFSLETQKGINSKLNQENTSLKKKNSKGEINEAYAATIERQALEISKLKQKVNKLEQKKQRVGVLCVGDYFISKLDDGSIWLRKQDGEGGGFDVDLFETFLNDFFSENF